MNCKQANEIPIKEIIESVGMVSNGIQKGKDIWYNSPFRDESKPSFKIDTYSNRWKDFGKAGKSEGTVIDFVIELKGCSVNQALSIIDDAIRGTRGQIKASFSSFLEQKDFEKSPDSKTFIDKLGEKKKTVHQLSDNLETVKIEELKNIALINYVRERKIDIPTAKEFLQEIYFRNKKMNKTFFALAFKNDSGAYEYKNKYLGGVIGHKDITSYEFSKSSEIAVFEGFFDFLTYFTLQGKKSRSGTVLVLNSVNLVGRAVEFIKNRDFKDVFLYLDNDSAGEESTQILINEFKDKVHDKRNLYEGFKDYNEYLQKTV